MFTRGDSTLYNPRDFQNLPQSSLSMSDVKVFLPSSSKIRYMQKFRDKFEPGLFYDVRPSLT